MADRKRTMTYLVVVAAVVVVGVIAAVFASRPQLEPPAQAVQELLELRSQNATDVAAYARYVESTQAASALAQDSAGRADGKSAIPNWERLEVSKQTSKTAEVTVVWDKTAGFTDWPESTVFVMNLRGGSWKLTDAQASTPETGSVESRRAAPEDSGDTTGSGAP